MDTIKPFFEFADRFGVAAPIIGFLWWLYWQERSERREKDAAYLQLIKDQIAADKETAAALNMLSMKVSR